MAEDTVCGMQVNELTAKHTFDHKVKTYYFCAPGCKFQFSKTPEKFLGGHRIPMH
jgi:YHS domain-containing protein